MNKLHIKNKGVILPTIVFIVLFLTVSALALSEFAVNHFAATKKSVSTTNALLVAESGAEQTLYELNQNSSFTGFATEQQFFNSQEQGRGTYQTTVTDGNLQNEKIIIATGRVYLPSTSAQPVQTRKVRLIVVGTTSDSYSVRTGPGGLIMSNSATIANGDVRVNGYLSMSNSARIGSATNPVNVYVAHHNCPSGGGITYPTLCSSGQPITISNSAHIYGTVRATHQTNGTDMSDPGLISGSTADPLDLPTYDRQSQINAVTSTISSSAASCWGSQSKTINADVHVSGNMTLSNGCTITINGNLWIDGTFSISNSSKLRVADSVTVQPVIMVDGSSATLSNNSSILPNSNGIGVKMITFRSAASCSPNCNDVTGTDLYNSRDLQTLSISNSSLAPGSIFYARWSKINLSNSGSVGSVMGQTVHISNTGNISFGDQLSSGNSIWTIKNYQQIFD